MKFEAIPLWSIVMLQSKGEEESTKRMIDKIKGRKRFGVKNGHKLDAFIV